MSSWRHLAEIGHAAEDLGYEVESVTRDRVVLVARQDRVRVTVDVPGVSGDDLRGLLLVIPHRPGSRSQDWKAP